MKQFFDGVGYAEPTDSSKRGLVLRPGKQTPVVSLDWLLRHGHEVERIVIVSDFCLLALGQNFIYLIVFASDKVLTEFVTNPRRVWHGCKIDRVAELASLSTPIVNYSYLHKLVLDKLVKLDYDTNIKVIEG